MFFVFRMKNEKERLCVNLMSGGCGESVEYNYEGGTCVIFHSDRSTEIEGNNRLNFLNKTLKRNKSYERVMYISNVLEMLGLSVTLYMDEMSVMSQNIIDKFYPRSKLKKSLTAIIIFYVYKYHNNYLNKSMIMDALKLESKSLNNANNIVTSIIQKRYPEYNCYLRDIHILETLQSKLIQYNLVEYKPKTRALINHIIEHNLLKNHKETTIAKGALYYILRDKVSIDKFMEWFDLSKVTIQKMERTLDRVRKEQRVWSLNSGEFSGM